jgi:PLP dependent protein
MSELGKNLEQLEEAIWTACRRAARAREDVELMAVSKTFPADLVTEALALGLTLFGENRVQEYAAKAKDAGGSWSGPSGGRPRVHLIGHLQSNKAAKAVEVFDGVDSLDSVRLAERLNEAAGKYGKRLPVLIEVKLRKG